MPKRFIATENALDKGLAKNTPASGAKLVNDWVKELSDLAVVGAKGLHGELVQLERELKKDEPDADRIGALLGKIAPATVKLADKCEDEKVAAKVRSLGEALGRPVG